VDAEPQALDHPARNPVKQAACPRSRSMPTGSHSGAGLHQSPGADRDPGAGRSRGVSRLRGEVRQPVLTFLSDYGLRDDFVGVCHGVIATICPQARVIDITHGIPRQNVRAGALILRGALPYMPQAAVHLAVVDPGVGAKRRAVALRLGDGAILVGPDNGLLWPAAEGGGGVAEAVEIGSSPFRLQPVSSTFHGRDIFAPVAARLAGGATLAQAGERFSPAELVRLELPRPRLDNGRLLAHAVYIDAFGNVQLDIGPKQLLGLGLEPGRAAVVGHGHRARCGRTFADVAPGELLLYEDSYRRVALAVNQGSAAERLGVGLDDELAIRPQP
jgi:S-adenosylmethionine hydrolase